MAQSRKRRVPASKKKKASRNKGGGWIGTFLLVLFLAGAAAVAAGAYMLWPRCSGAECPDVRSLRDYSPPQATRVFDGNGEVVAHLAPERRIVVPLERIPGHVAGAFLAVEDRRFFEHDGVDYRRVLGSAVRNVQSMRFAEGFSTITMQLARNVFPEQLTRAKTLRRKVWEVFIARQMEREFAKDEILEMYLNQIYLGDGFYGVEAAAQGYFGKTAAELNTSEAAMLAALPKAPNDYNPRTNPIDSVTRRNLVLSLMRDAGLISATEAERAAGEPIRLVTPLEGRSEAPYFIAAVRRELRARLGDNAETEGYRVYTALDRRMQRSATTALRDQLAAVERGELGTYRGPRCTTQKIDDPAACLQGLFVAMENRTGNVLALIGGRDFNLSQFNRVTQAQRQAGSAFKPFIFATALAAGTPINTPLLGPGAADYEGGYQPADHVATDAPVDLREAMRLSSNQAAVVLGEQVGVGNVVRTAKAMGLSTPIQDYPSTLLGAAEVIPIEMVSAFTAFPNGGTMVEPRLIQRVEDSNGRVVWAPEVVTETVLSPEVAFLTTNLMQDVVDRGTGSRVRSAGLPAIVPAAGKTGTTNDAADAWFVGFTPDVAAAVWVGFDKRQRITVGGGGGTVAAPIFGRVMGEYYANRPIPAPWAPPANVISVSIDRTSGELATESCPPESLFTEWFIIGTEPQTYCTLHSTGIDGWFDRSFRQLGELFGGGGRRREPVEEF